MERDGSRHKAFTRRMALLGGGQLSLAALLMGRMYYLQVLQADQYKMLAEENRISMRLLAPPRGLVLDRFGQELASNRQNYRVVLIAEQTDGVAETLDRLARIIPIYPHQRSRVLREVKRKRPFVPIKVVENLTWEQFARVNVQLPDLPGVQPDVGEGRFYPKGTETAHIVGYVSSVSEADLTGDPLLELPGFRIGKNGIEKIYDESLRGKAGNSRVEVNAYGRVIRELARQDGQSGDNVVLTIDTKLQEKVARRLADESAAAVVMDIHSGEVLSMVSSPSYDPNAFNLGMSNKDWQSLVRHPRKPLINKAISGQYPPGSTFKMIVALAALEAGIAGAGHRVFCSGVIKLGNTKFHCWRHRYGGHGWVDMKQSIAQSCDIYFYDLARRLGVDRMGAMARRFGLGETFGIELTGEKDGLVPSKDWKLAVKGVPWQLGETLITGIGQAYLLATPLQLAVMTSRLANGGMAVRPRLSRRLDGKIPAGDNAEEAAAAAQDSDDGTQNSDTAAQPIGVSAANLKVVTDAMSEVVNGARGTARKYKLDKELNAKMAGKTGTAQVRRITKSERLAGGKLSKETPWKERDHALFTAFAPVGAPRYATVVVVEHGGSGTYAARLSKDIMTEVLRSDPLGRSAVGMDGGGPRKERKI
ncbi:MAG: penicillin-binding protein 2 [Rhodospirillaceae bacterium]|jgi:penicillin-binding protein 2|nr:penicillin-binding protein 2 [Rhodospirillaceae bacterium]